MLRACSAGSLLPPCAKLGPLLFQLPPKFMFDPDVTDAFLTGLRDGRIEGVRTADGRVLVPPLEYDPDSGESTTDFVEVGTSGVVTTWAWVAEPRRFS